MKISRSYQFRFYPTREQESQLAVEFGNSRWVWNWGLRRRIETYAKCKRELHLLKQKLENHAKFARRIFQEKKVRTFTVQRVFAKVRISKNKKGLSAFRG